MKINRLLLDYVNYYVVIVFIIKNKNKNGTIHSRKSSRESKV